MTLRDACKATGLTRKAIEWYQQQGLVHIQKGPNGYREFTPEDIRRLEEISLWRQLGLRAAEMRRMTKTEDRAGTLGQIAAAHTVQLQAQQQKLQDLHRLAAYYAHPSGPLPRPSRQSETMLQKLELAFPGSFGRLLVSHFAPYLQQPAETPAQTEALQEIIEYLDALHFRPPWQLRLSDWVLQRTLDNGKAKEQTAAASLLNAGSIDRLLHADEEELARFKQTVLHSLRLRQKWYIKYSPLVQAGRHMRNRLQKAGYYDVMLPAMHRASPAYAAYAQKLEALNERLCAETGIHYDEKGYFGNLTENR